MKRRRSPDSGMRVLVVGGLLFTAAAALVVGAAPVHADEGATLYRTLCASCHGVDGRGDGPAAGALTPPPTDLTRSKLTMSELMKVIDGRRTIRAHGDAAMPVWGRVFAEALEGSGRARLDTLRTEEILARYVQRLAASPAAGGDQAGGGPEPAAD